MSRGVLTVTALTVLSLLTVPAVHASSRATVEVVVTLKQPGLAGAMASSRALSARSKTRRLDLHSPTSTAYVAQLEAMQREVARQILRAVPSARVRWHYQVVLDGLAVVLPADRLPALARVPGVAHVWPGMPVAPALDQAPELIGADQLWGLPSFSTAGNGIKIGIIDDGIDQKHPFFGSTGYAYPPGFPKGNTSYTTPKVIVARAFAPPNTSWKYAHLPFDPVYSDHGTHVAGIAAGDYTPGAVVGRGPLSGVAPKAYLGNYKMNSRPVAGQGLCCENSVELAAAVEAAVRDGMDVINISYGEAELNPRRSLLEQAIDGAAAAGVVPVVSAGNYFHEFGRGSLDSPASTQAGIAVAAVTKSDVIADFSGSGPSPISLRMKPDVSAPGVSILSSVPNREGTWTQFSGTSMAAPMVAGAAALLRQRHPEWSVAQIKAALVLTGGPVYADGAHKVEVPTTREGGGLINVPRANDPLFFASPSTLSFGLLRTGTTAAHAIGLTDAGGAGTWKVHVQLQVQPEGVSVTTTPTATVPGQLRVRASAGAHAVQQDVTGFVVLTRNADSRRIPFWFRVERPRLGAPTSTLVRTGDYGGSTRGKPSKVLTYRYPDNASAVGIRTVLPGPEEVFRVDVRRTVANFGAVLSSSGRNVRVTPRLVKADNENRLLGYPALPLNLNPYLPTWFATNPVVAAIRPARGTYDLVFDTFSARTAGRFSFRFWVNDTSPPSVRLLTPRVAAGGSLRIAAADRGSGVDPTTLQVRIDGGRAGANYTSTSSVAGLVTVRLPSSLRAGRHLLEVQVSDYQEEKNSESVPGVLPNTAFFRRRFVVTR